MRRLAIAKTLLGLVVAVAGTGSGGPEPAGAATSAEFQATVCKGAFDDVPASNDYCPWIEQIVTDGVASACQQGKFCPDAPVTRQQIALLLERAMRGTASWQVDAATLDGLDSSAFVTASSLDWKSFRRRYYLDFPSFAGDHALEACAAPGFHMASLWEIQDLGTLVYVHPPGVTPPDLSGGPPSGQIGWVMTGGYPSNLNCQNWTSATGTGAIAYLPELGLGWFVNDNGTSENVDYNTVPWKTTLFSCGEQTGVWCVED